MFEGGSALELPLGHEGAGVAFTDAGVALQGEVDGQGDGGGGGPAQAQFADAGIAGQGRGWGNMLTGANNSVVIQQYWWRWVFPAAVFGICTICINLVGDALRDAFDPKSAER